MDHVQWVAGVLKKMQAIQVGMTRAELLSAFNEEGGLSTGISRRYVSRDCPMFKVDVTFRAVGRPERDREGRVTLTESPQDLIVELSRPFLELPIAD